MSLSSLFLLLYLTLSLSLSPPPIGILPNSGVTCVTDSDCCAQMVCCMQTLLEGVSSSFDLHGALAGPGCPFPLCPTRDYIYDPGKNICILNVKYTGTIVNATPYTSLTNCLHGPQARVSECMQYMNEATRRCVESASGYSRS